MRFYTYKYTYETVNVTGISSYLSIKKLNFVVSQIIRISLVRVFLHRDVQINFI